MGDSQASGDGGRRRSWSISHMSRGPDLLVPSSYASRQSGKRPRRGEWWSTEMGVPVEIGNDFVPDSEVGGGDDFIFFPDSQGQASNELGSGSDGEILLQGGGFDDTATTTRDDVHDRALKHAHQQVQRLRQRFPPLPSLSDDLRNFMASTGRNDNKLLLRCGIKLLTVHRTTNLDDGLIDDDDSEPLGTNETSQLLLSSSSNTWSGGMFKSMTPSGPPCPPPGAAMSACGAPSSPSTAGMFRSRRPAPPPPPPPPAAAGTSSSSNPGGLLRSKSMGVSMNVEDEDKN